MARERYGNSVGYASPELHCGKVGGGWRDQRVKLPARRHELVVLLVQVPSGRPAPGGVGHAGGAREGRGRAVGGQGGWLPCDGTYP